MSESESFVKFLEQSRKDSNENPFAQTIFSVIDCLSSNKNNLSACQDQADKFMKMSIMPYAVCIDKHQDIEKCEHELEAYASIVQMPLLHCLEKNSQQMEDCKAEEALVSVAQLNLIALSVEKLA